MEEQLVFTREQPAGTPLHDQIAEPPLGARIGINFESLLEQRIKFGAVLLLDGHRLGIGNEGRSELARGELDGAVKIFFAAHRKATLATLARGLVADEELLDDSVLESWIEFVRAVDQGFHLRLFGDEFRMILGERKSRSPGNGCPIEQGNISSSCAANRRFWVFA